MITGFQAQMSVDDGGTGAAPGGASTRFVGLTMFSLPELEATKFEATELDQDDGATPTAAPDPYERERPTGLIKVGVTPASIKYTKANYQRLQSLLQRGAAGAEHTFVLTSPDDQTTPGTPVKLTTTLKAFVSKLGAVQFEKGAPVAIPFEICVRKKPAYA